MGQAQPWNGLLLLEWALLAGLNFEQYIMAKSKSWKEKKNVKQWWMLKKGESILAKFSQRIQYFFIIIIVYYLMKAYIP